MNVDTSGQKEGLVNGFYITPESRLQKQIRQQNVLAEVTQLSQLSTANVLRGLSNVVLHNKRQRPPG